MFYFPLNEQGTTESTAIDKSPAQQDKGPRQPAGLVGKI